MAGETGARNACRNAEATADLPPMLPVACTVKLPAPAAVNEAVALPGEEGRTVAPEPLKMAQL